MIVAQDLAKSYGKNRVLKNLTFHVPRNHILAIAGANGAGKTTLLKLLALILRPDAGRILIDGEDAQNSPRRCRDLIGYVPQSNAFFGELTVRENFDYWRGASAGEDAAAVLGLEGAMGQKASNLSGGMQRRLNLALGLLNGPKALIMDEPLTGVDVKTRQAILRWMVSLREGGMTIVYSTHHTDEIAHTADDLITLKAGEITYCGPMDGLRGGELLENLFAQSI